MKYCKIGAIEEWTSTTSITFDAHGAKYVGVKLQLLPERDTIMTVTENATSDEETGEVIPHYFAVNRGEITEVELKMLGGGTIEFDHACNVNTRNNRTGSYQTTGPVFVRPPKERVRDPQVELIRAMSKINEENRKNAEYTAFQKQKDELAAIKAEIDAKLQAAQPKPATVTPAAPAATEETD